MTVIYTGLLSAAGAKGIGIDVGSYSSVAAQSFTKAFKSIPTVFLQPTSDDLVHAASSATTGFTPTASTAGSSGAGTAGNWLAVGVGTKNTINKYLGSGWGIEYGTCTIGSAKTFSRSFREIPTIILTPTADEGAYVASAATTGFTPTATTGTGGAGTTCNYLAIGRTTDTRNNVLTGVGAAEKGGLWIELGTATVDGAVTFTYPFKAAPVVLTRLTSDAQPIRAASTATTGFTPTQGTCAGQGAGTTCVYLALGEKDF